MKRIARRMFCHVLLPLFLGGSIYLLMRPLNLLMFSWVESLGLMQELSLLREALSDHISTPRWVVFSLPNALWAYATTAFLIIIWQRSPSQPRTIWITLGASLALVAEIGQAMQFVPGSYSHIDFLACGIATALCLAVVYPDRDVCMTKHQAQQGRMV